MNTYDQYDVCIARIMSKIEDLGGEKRGFGYKVMSKIEVLRGKKRGFEHKDWNPIWEPPLSEDDVAAFEAEKGIQLPADYRRFITAYASAGKQPFGELYPLRQAKSAVENPFPYTLDNILYFLYMTDEEMDYFEDNDTPFTADHGLLKLCHEGCGMESVLVVNSNDADTYGTVWFFDLANDYGIVPMYDKKTGKPFHFLDWLEYWVDRTASLACDEYFSFSETVRLPEPPDNPDIMGRKMGWIQ